MVESFHRRTYGIAEDDKSTSRKHLGRGRVRKDSLDHSGVQFDDSEREIVEISELLRSRSRFQLS